MSKSARLIELTVRKNDKWRECFEVFLINPEKLIETVVGDDLKLYFSSACAIERPIKEIETPNPLRRVNDFMGCQFSKSNFIR